MTTTERLADDRELRRRIRWNERRERQILMQAMERLAVQRKDTP